MSLNFFFFLSCAGNVEYLLIYDIYFAKLKKSNHFSSSFLFH